MKLLALINNPLGTILNIWIQLAKRASFYEQNGHIYPDKYITSVTYTNCISNAYPSSP